MKAPKPSTKEMVMERLANGKPQIISSFLEDCLKADGAEDKVSYFFYFNILWSEGSV